MSDPAEILVCGETYKVRKLSAYEAKKLLGTGLKDLADMDVDLLLAAVVEPRLKKEEIHQYDSEKYYALVEAVEEVNRTVIAALGNSIKKALRPSKLKSNES